MITLSGIPFSFLSLYISLMSMILFSSFSTDQICEPLSFLLTWIAGSLTMAPRWKVVQKWLIFRIKYKHKLNKLYISLMSMILFSCFSTDQICEPLSFLLPCMVGSLTITLYWNLQEKRLLYSIERNKKVWSYKNSTFMGQNETN